jgi:hypothetical protein
MENEKDKESKVDLDDIFIWGGTLAEIIAGFFS